MTIYKTGIVETTVIYTSSTADIQVPAGDDLTIKMGDAAAANKVSFTDSAGIEVAWIDSDGVASFAGGGADFFADDIQLKFGNTSASPDATIEWDSSAAPNCLLTTSAFNVLAGDFKQTQGATDMFYLDARTTPHTFTAGILDIDLTTATTNNKGIDIDVISTSTTGIITSGQVITVIDNGVVTGTNQNMYGLDIGMTKNGADTSADTCAVTGIHCQISSTGSTDAGTKITKGIDLYVDGDTAGTSEAYGSYSYTSGADNTYGYYTSVQGGGTNYGLYALATTQVGETGYAIHATATGGGTNYAGYFDGLVAMNNELDLTGVSALIDLNPANTGTANIIDITPSASLSASSVWIGTYTNVNSTDPATGAASYVVGNRFVATSCASVDGNATLIGFCAQGGPSDNSIGHCTTMTELTADKTQTSFKSHTLDAAITLSATGTYRGLHVDWDQVARDAGAPVLEGTRIEMPADYSNFGTSFGAYISGDARSVTVCSTDYALDVLGLSQFDSIAVDVEAVTASVNTSRDSYYFGCDTVGADTITLQSADCVDGRIIVVKDEGGNASAQNIIIDTEGAETIDGNASVTLMVDYICVKLIARNSNWYII